MTFSAPSYLSRNRLGTYYFRCRIPESVRQQYHCDKVEVRKSLQTKDFKMALENARKLWVQMVDNNFYLSTSKNRPEKVKESEPVDSVEGRSVVTWRREENIGSEKLSDLLDKYCAENSSRWDGTYEHKDVRPIISVLCEVTGDKPRSSFGTEDVVKFKEVYTQLPKNRKKILKNWI